MTPLYRRIIAHAETPLGRPSLDVERPLLAHKVWDPTPWVIDVHTGSLTKDDGWGKRQSMHEWLQANAGRESWPIHEKPGDWHWGGATVDGWTWLGFATEDRMRAFLAAFPEDTRAP